MISGFDSCEDCLEDLVLNKQSGNPTFSLHKEIASSEVIHEIHDSKGCDFLSEELPDIDSFNDIHPYFDDDPLSDSTTCSANSLLEEFTDELALISYPLDYDDNRACDIESDIREIEFLLYQGENYDLKDSIDKTDLNNLDDLFVDPTPEMFTDEQPPDYSFPPRFDVYPNDFLEIESDAKFDNNSFDFKGEKIKESELLIDQLDLPGDILSEYDSFNFQDFSRDDVLPSPDNEDKVFNPRILIHEKSVKIITPVTQDKKLAVSFTSWLFEDFDPPFYELLVFKEVPNSMRLLPFSFKNEEKVFKPGIYISKKFHCCFLSKLSHPVDIRRVVPRNYNPKGERFLIASRFPTPPLACASFSLRATVTSSSQLARDQTSNPTSSANPTPKATMTDNRTMAEMLRAPTEGCAEAIVVPPILAEQFELKHSLINMMTSEQFFGLEKDNPHDHIRCKNSTNLFMRPGKDIKISFVRVLITALLDTFYNALNPADQDSLNAAAGGNLLEKSPQDALTIIKNKSKVRNSRSKPIASPVNACDNHSSSEIAKLTHAVNQQTSAMTTVMMAMLKQLQSNPPPAQVKAVEEICVTCGGAHPYYQCLATGGNTFLEFRDNIQGYVSAAAGIYDQGNLGYHPQGEANQMRPPGFAQPNVQNNQNGFGQPQGFNRTTNFNQEQPYQATTQSNQNFYLNELEKIKRMNDVSLKAMKNQIDMMNTASTLGSGSLPGDTVANPKGKLKAITTRSGLVTDGPTIPTPSKSVNPEEDECVEDTYTDPDLAKYTIKVPPPPVQKPKPLIQRNFVLHTRDSPLPHIPDPRVPLILRRPFLRTARALINVYGEKMILRDGDERLTLNMKHDTTSYSNHPHRESANLINIFNLSSEDFLEDLFSNKQSGNPTFSLHKEIASPKVIHEIYDSMGCTFLSEEFPDIDSFNDIHPYFDDDPLSGNTTYSANSLLEEFADELVVITYPPDYDDNRTCDVEFDLREIEFLLYHGKDSDFKDSIDQSDLANCDDLFVDPTPEMFTDEQPLDYSFLLRFNVYPDDFLEIESNDNNFDNDSFDSKGEKIKEVELLIDQLNLPCDILSEYDSFNSQDFSRDDDLPSPDNENKVFNPGILIHEKSVIIITRVAQEKKLAISFAFLLFEDFDPPIYELLVFKEVPNSMRLLLFSSENEEKVFKPGIYTTKKVKEKPRKGQNQIKTGQKQEAWRNREKSKAVTVDKER
nr:hypothetical protein [Tanacetum cinerariifolium]